MEFGKYKYIMIILLIFNSLNIFSQDSLLTNIDAITYRLYTEKNWNKLIKVSKKAIENDIDYYYLRMRLGIAYFEQRKYNLAYPQFKKAKQFNDNDIVKEYLYYSYLYGGNYAKAEELASGFNEQLKQKLGIKNPKFVQSAMFNYGIIINNDYDKLLNLRLNETNQYTLNNRFRDEINQYFSADFRFYFNKNLSAAFSYSKLIEPKTQIIHYHDYLSDTINTEKHTNKTIQNNIYFNLFHHNKDIDWYIALNFVNIKDNYIVFEEADPVYLRKDLDYKYTDALLTAGFETKQTFTAFGLNAGISGLGEERQIQIGGTIKIFPKANRNFIIYAMPYYQNISVSEFVQAQGRRGGYYERYTVEDNVVIKTGILTMPVKNFYVDLKAYFGRLNQFNDNMGYLIFNDVDAITSMYNATLTYKYKRLTIFASYSYLEKEHKYQEINYYIIQPVVDDQKIINISNQSIIGGISWYF